MASNDNDVVMTIRVPESMSDRMRELREAIAQKRAFVMKSTLTRSDLVRYVLLRGIEALEQDEDDASSDVHSTQPGH